MKKAVLKFGGSSVATIDKMKKIADKLQQRYEKNESLVVVVSAMGKSTNKLLDLAQEASTNPAKREIDMLISTGEQVSISLLTMILKDRGLKATALTGFQAGVYTEGRHTKNIITDIDISRVEKHLDDGKIVVVAGFQGINTEGDITTLGRGGSDTSAVALAAKLGCPAEIYTDVTGIYGVDPRMYPKASKMDYVSYEEMKELAFLGAKVMEHRSIEIGERYNVPIYVASTHSDELGTWIMEGSKMEQKSISGVSASDNVLVVGVKHLPNDNHAVAKLFVDLAEADVLVDMINQNYSSKGLLNVSFTASTDDQLTVEEILNDVQKQHPDVLIKMNNSIVKVSVVGVGMRTQKGVAAKLFELLANNDITFRLVTTSEISISITIEKDLKEKAVQVIADYFEL